MIRNPRFAEPGSGPGMAAGWTLRTVCQAEQIAPFGGAPVEAFDRWTMIATTFVDGTLALAVFAGADAKERFAWPLPELREELSGGVVASALRDAFLWATAPLVSSWTDVASLGAAFAGSARETFERGWRADDLVVALADQQLARGTPIETFDVGWAPNPTLH